MKKRMGQKILSYTLVGALAIGTFYFFFTGGPDAAQVLSAVRFSGETVVIDAGHGGEDGGAVSVSGVAESGINLAVALKLDQIFGLFGVETVLLRSEDISLHDSSAETLRQKKVSDLHNRVDRIESIKNATLISIHQNTYSGSPKYHGAQVFYANEALSLPLAQQTQQTLRQVLDPENGRVPAPIPDSVYLMNHITCRAILIECGFLSNPEEDLRLQDAGYQTKIASALAGAYLGYCTGIDWQPEAVTGADWNEQMFCVGEIS